MSHQEKRIIVSLITSILVFIFYGMFMREMYLDGYLSTQKADSIVGKSIFALILLSIVVSVVAQIVVSIILTMVTGERTNFFSDERDKLIELKGMQITLIAFSIGYLGSMALLATGTAAYLVFILIIFSMFIGSTLGDIGRLYFYRRGF